MRSQRHAVLLVGLLTWLPVFAHHSNAMYDQDKTVTLHGTVKDFQWTNPHCWIQLAVAGSSGGEEWSVQMGPPVNLFRDGWRPSALHVGDDLLVQIHPMRDGSRGGIWISGTHGDGSAIGRVAK